MSDDNLIAELEQENRLLRARNERMAMELDLQQAVLRVTAEQRDKAVAELSNLSEAVAKRLEQAGAGMQAGLIREVFINQRAK